MSASPSSRSNGLAARVGRKELEGRTPASTGETREKRGGENTDKERGEVRENKGKGGGERGGRKMSGRKVEEMVKSNGFSMSWRTERRRGDPRQSHDESESRRVEEAARREEGQP